MRLISTTAVFACLSKACAPPPTGRGGSLDLNDVTITTSASRRERVSLSAWGDAQETSLRPLRSSTVRSLSTAVFACMSKVCAPPPVGTGGSVRVSSGASLMWRFEGGSWGITSAAAELLGMSGWDGSESGQDIKVAKEFLDAIDASPVSSRVLYSGQVLQERLNVGEEIEYPLMATTHSKKVAGSYAYGGVTSSTVPLPHSTKEMKKEWRTLPTPLRDAIGPSNVPHGYTVGKGRDRSLPSLFKLLSSKSVPVSNWERVTSGKFKVVSHSTERIKGAWVYDYDIHDYRELTRDVYEIEYVGPAGGE